MLAAAATGLGLGSTSWSTGALLTKSGGTRAVAVDSPLTLRKYQSGDEPGREWGDPYLEARSEARGSFIRSIMSSTGSDVG